MEEYREKPAPVLGIVLGIILFLIIGAVLFPALVPPRDNDGRKYSCMNNLKEIGIALQLYWNDYDGTLPSSALVNHSRKWNPRDFDTFSTRRGEVPVPPGRNPVTWTEVLHDHMKNKDVVWCPSDPEARDSPGARVSYWYKVAMDKAWYGEGCTKACSNQMDFAYNADQIVFYEHLGWHHDSGNGLRSGVQINVVYLDSHVKTVALQNATSGNAIDCAANSNGEPMYFNYDNKTSSRVPDNTPARFIDPDRYSDKL